MKAKRVLKIGGIGLLALVGIGVVAQLVGGDDPPVVPPYEKGTYVRPYGDDAPWNIPVSDYAKHPDSDELVERFWGNSNVAGITDPERRGRVELSLDRWSSPIYDASTAEGTKRVFTASYGFPGNVDGGAEVPWSDWWEPAAGDDKEMIILDEETGREWNLWLVQKTNFSGCLGTGLVPFKDLCVGSANLVSGPDGQPADYRTYVGGFPSKGAGLPGLSLILTSQEVADGQVQHAVGMDIYNTMFGPECTDAQMGTNAAGNECGYFVSPATRLEWKDGPATCGNRFEGGDSGRSKTVPEGTRFALDMTDEEIESWLDTRGYTNPRRETARIIAVGLREYGWIISDTSCGGVSIPTEGTTSPPAARLWKSLGINGDEQKNLLENLFTQDNIYAVEAAEPIPSGTRFPK